MTRLALLVGVFASSAFASEALVAAKDLAAGSTVTAADVTTVPVPDALDRVTVTAQSLPQAVLRFPLRKGDLVLKSAFTTDVALVKRCEEVLERRSR